MINRIISGFGANAFGQAVNIIVQFLSLPLFLHYWDTATYGSWLLLSAIPAYLFMADVGMVQVSANRMTMAVGRSDTAEANRIFQSAQVFMIIVCGSLTLLVVPLALWGPLPWPLSYDERCALAALFCMVLLGLFGGLSEAVFRATGRYALGILLNDTIRLSDWGASILGLALFGNFSGVAVCGLLSRLCGMGIAMALTRLGGCPLHWGTGQASATEIKRMAWPAVNFMAFPLANALSFQGGTLLVGALLGPVAVATFNTFRTIARIAVQLTAMFSHALWPEFARLFGQGGVKRVVSLFRSTAIIGAAQALGLSVIVYFVSPWLLEIWTHGRIEFSRTLMIWMLAYAAVGGTWHIPRILLLSTNQHVGLGGWSITVAALSILLAWGFGALWQLNGIGFAMFVSEGLIASICIYRVNRCFFRVCEKMSRSSS
jgi:O-antigen/teichoic acid export membrane protein